jgi:hypothetical protein
MQTHTVSMKQLVSTRSRAEAACEASKPNGNSLGRRKQALHLHLQIGQFGVDAALLRRRVRAKECCQAHP